jgi:ABC-type multidrug transport system permease subunit
MSVAGAVLRRTLIHTYKNPAIIVPSLAFPLVFLLAFAGGLSNVSNVPGFEFAAGYTAFQFVFVFLQMAAFGGIFTGYRLAEDYESGFARRLMLGAPSRTGLILGLVASGLVRYVVIGAILWALALVTGMDVLGSVPEILGLIALGALMNIACTLWTTGLAFRYQTVDIGSSMQTPVFVLLFLAPVYVPLALLTGWLKGAASINPVTLIVDAGRGFIAGEPDKVLYAFLVSFALAGLMWAWAAMQMRRAERGA